MMKNFRTSWRFSRRYRQYLQVVNLSQGLVTEKHTLSKESKIALEHLNRKKIACQRKIGELGLPSIADCKSCISGCCGDPATYYFTPIDYWLARHGSPRTFPYRQLQQVPFHQIIKKQIMGLWQRMISFHGTSVVPQRSELKGCEYMSVGGCVLSHNERPIMCHMFVCSRLRTTMDDATSSAYLKLTDQLYWIARETFVVLKKEAGVPRKYGTATLVMTL